MAYLKTLSPSCGFTDVLGYFADRFLLYNGTHLVFKVNIHFFKIWMREIGYDLLLV